MEPLESRVGGDGIHGLSHSVSLSSRYCMYADEEEKETGGSLTDIIFVILEENHGQCPFKM